MLVGLLTLEQKNELEGQLVQPSWYFYPIEDCDDNWVISIEEMENSIYPQNEWVKTLPLIEYCEKIKEIFIASFE
jgi:hypothetical protein